MIRCYFDLKRYNEGSMKRCNAQKYFSENQQCQSIERNDQSIASLIRLQFFEFGTSVNQLLIPCNQLMALKNLQI